jgi:DNA-binding IclR family transcriptional regulator
MSGARAKATLTKQWKLLEALRPAERGLGVRELCARTGIAKSTLYRYLEILGADAEPAAEGDEG